jgi:hypothetical protein
MGLSLRLGLNLGSIVSGREWFGLEFGFDFVWGLELESEYG